MLRHNCCPFDIAHWINFFNLWKKKGFGSCTANSYLNYYILALDIVGSAWSFCFFIPATTSNDLRLWRIFYPRFYPSHLFSYLNSCERASIFPCLMLSAKQGNYWYHAYNVFGMTRSLTGDWTWDLPHSKPTLYHSAIEGAVMFFLIHQLIIIIVYDIINIILVVVKIIFTFIFSN